MANAQNFKEIPANIPQSRRRIIPAIPKILPPRSDSAPASSSSKSPSPITPVTTPAPPISAPTSPKVILPVVPLVPPKQINMQPSDPPGSDEYHKFFMREAINMAELALQTDETPVGCVFVRNGEIIGRGMNDTNKSLNGTRHAEFVAIAEILKKYPASILRQTDLYVTVEPCIMCASALRQFGIRAVYFGCFNDRFGGTGGVLKIHDDPSVEKPYPARYGIYREEAIMLLRRFYIQENEKAPEPKQKKTRELKTDIVPLEIANKGLIEQKKDKDVPDLDFDGQVPLPQLTPET